MGTNYYISTWTTKDKNEIVNTTKRYLKEYREAKKNKDRVVSEEILRNMIDYFRDLEYTSCCGEYDEKKKRFHIGKSSGGWQFLFDCGRNINDITFNSQKISKPITCEYFKTTRKSIDKFLRKNEAKGNFIFDEYGKKISVDDFWKMVDLKKDELTDESYRKKHPEEMCYFNRPSDFICDGLRFSVFTDFR